MNALSIAWSVITQKAAVLRYVPVKTASAIMATMNILLVKQQWTDVQGHSTFSSQKPIFYFLLVVNCNLNFISHRYLYVLQTRKAPNPSFSRDKGIPYFVVKLTVLKVGAV